MMEQGFRGNCDSQASWGCAPALPNCTQVVSLRQAAGNQKFFGAAVFQKCCRGVGEQPTFAEQIELHNATATKIYEKIERIAIAFQIERL